MFDRLKYDWERWRSGLLLLAIGSVLLTIVGFILYGFLCLWLAYPSICGLVGIAAIGVFGFVDLAIQSSRPPKPKQTEHFKRPEIESGG